MIKYFYPDLSANLGVGVQYNRNGKVRYNLRGKQAFQVTSNELLSFNIKGRCDVDEEFGDVNYTGAAEFTWNITDVKKDQNLHIKFGYKFFDKIPYLQIRESNWTFNADANRRWNISYDL